MEMHKDINVFMLDSSTISILQPLDQEIIMTFKSYLRNTFHMVIPAIDIDSSDRPGQSTLKTFRKGFTILDAIQNIHDL